MVPQEAENRSTKRQDVLSRAAQHRGALLAQCAPGPDTDVRGPAPIHVTRWSSEGPAILLIHGGVQGGLGGGPATFAKQEDLIRRGFQVLVPDRPGFGRSASRGPDDMEADAAWISDMLGQEIHLVGHSWGGAEALLAAARRSASVRSLVMVEPALFPLLASEPGLAARPAIRADLARTAAASLSAQTPGEYGLAFARTLGASADGGPNAAAAALDADPDRAAALGCALLRARMASPQAMRQAADAIAHAGTPVLVISGGYSPAFDAVGEVVDGLTHGRHFVLESPNHFIHQIKADAFNNLLEQFIQDCLT